MNKCDNMVKCIECGMEPKWDITAGTYICKCYPDFPKIKMPEWRDD